MASLSGVRRRWRTLRRHVLARRRPLAALCAAAAALVGLRVTAAPAPASVPVPVAARDLPAGAVLGAGDLTTARFAPGTAPDRLPDDPVGRVLAAPVGAGEPVTDVRLVGDGLAAAHPGLTVMPVRLPDAGIVALLRPGDRIDLLAADPATGEARPLAAAALVLAVPEATQPADAASAPPGRLVVLGLSPTAAPDVGAAAVTQFLVVVFSR